MPNAPKKNSDAVAFRTYDQVAHYLRARAKAADISYAQFCAMVMIQWLSKGGDPVHSSDKQHMTPGLRMRAMEIGEEAVEFHGWQNFIKPPCSEEELERRRNDIKDRADQESDEHGSSDTDDRRAQ